MKWSARFYEDTIAYQYIVCFSFSMMLNSGKDTSPISTAQTVVNILLILFGIAIYGHVLSQFLEIKQEMAEMSIALGRMSRSLVLGLNDLNMTADVREEASLYIKLISNIDFHQRQLDKFFSIMSPGM